MTRKFVTEVLIAFVLVVILLSFVNGPHLLMPMTSETMLVVILAVFFTLFSALVWREDARDERERLHRLQAGRISYLAGTTILALGVIYQSFTHEIDPWLVGALIVMVLSKIFSRIYSQFKS